MKKNTKRIFSIIIAALSILFFIWIFLTPPKQLASDTKIETNQSSELPQPQKKPPVSINHETSIGALSPALRAENNRARIDDFRRAMTAEIALWQAPLIYFGKVVDESNQPIAGVMVSYGASSMNESLTEIYNKGVVTSDERGLFKIDKVRGVNLMVQLSHPNYYPYPENSTGFDKRHLPKVGYFPESEGHAELFRMHSKGNPAQLVHRVDGMDVPFDGNAKILDLRGSDYNQKIGQLVVAVSGSPPLHYDKRPFDWRIKITVPNGGLIEYTDRFDFVAPNVGYQSSMEFSYPKESPVWTDTIIKNYFLQLPSGYVRLNVYAVAKAPLFFSVEYDYNPDGSSNLERAR